MNMLFLYHRNTFVVMKQHHFGSQPAYLPCIEMLKLSFPFFHFLVQLLDVGSQRAKLTRFTRSQMLPENVMAP